MLDTHREVAKGVEWLLVCGGVIIILEFDLIKKKLYTPLGPTLF